MFKLLELNGLAAYFNTEKNFTPCPRQVDDNFLNIFELLIPDHHFVESDEPQVSCEGFNALSPLTHQYLLDPISGTGKMKLNKNAKTFIQPNSKSGDLLSFIETALARHSLSLDFSSFSVTLDNTQYQELLNVVTMFRSFFQLKKYRSFRPKHSYTEDPLSWFQYAVKTILFEQEEKRKKWAWDYIKQRRPQREKFLELFYLKMKPTLLDQTPTVSLLSPSQLEELESLERILEFDDLLTYRGEVYKRLDEELAARRRLESATTQQSPVKSWLSSWWNWGSTVPRPTDGSSTDILSSHNENSMALRLQSDDINRILDAIDYNPDADAASGAVSIQSEYQDSSRPSTPVESKSAASSAFLARKFEVSIAGGSLRLLEAPSSPSLTEITFKNVCCGFLEQVQILNREKGASDHHIPLEEKDKPFCRNFYVVCAEVEFNENIVRTSSFRSLISTSRTCKEKKLPVTLLYVSNPLYDPSLDSLLEIHLRYISFVLNKDLLENIWKFFSMKLCQAAASEQEYLFDRAVEKLEDLKSFTSMHLQYLMASRKKTSLFLMLEDIEVFLPLVVKSELDAPMFMVSVDEVSLHSSMDVRSHRMSMPEIPVEFLVEENGLGPSDAYEFYDAHIVGLEVQFFTKADQYFSNLAVAQSILHPCSFEAIFCGCIVLNDVSLPQFKIFINVSEELTLSLTDVQYQLIMLLTDIFFPTVPEDLASILTRKLVISGNESPFMKQLTRDNDSSVSGTTVCVDKPSTASTESTEESDSKEIFYDPQTDLTFPTQDYEVIHITSPSDEPSKSLESLKRGNYLGFGSKSEDSDSECIRKLVDRRRFILYLEVKAVKLRLGKSIELMAEYPDVWATSGMKSRLDLVFLEFQDISLFFIKRDLDLRVNLATSSFSCCLSPVLETIEAFSSSYSFDNPFVAKRLPLLADLTNSPADFPFISSSNVDRNLSVYVTRCLPMHPGFTSSFNSTHYKIDIALSEIHLRLQPVVISNLVFFIQTMFVHESLFCSKYRVNMPPPLPWMPASQDEPLHVNVNIQLECISSFLLETDRFVFANIVAKSGAISVFQRFSCPTESEKKLIKVNIDGFTVESFEHQIIALDETELYRKNLLYFVEESNVVELEMETITSAELSSYSDILDVISSNSTDFNTQHYRLKVRSASLMIHCDLFYLRLLVNFWNNLMLGVDMVYRLVEGSIGPSTSPSYPHFSIEMETPVLLFDRPDHEPSKNQCLVFHLGKVSLHNEYPSAGISDISQIIKAELECFSLFSIDLNDLIEYHPIYTKKSSILQPATLSCVFQFLDPSAVNESRARTSLLDCIIEFKEQAEAELDCPKLYLFFERFFWAIGETVKLGQYEETKPSYSEDMSEATRYDKTSVHTFELQVLLSKGLSISVLSDANQKYCILTLLNFEITFLARGDGSTDLTLQVGALSIIRCDRDVIELIQPYENNDSNENQLTITYSTELSGNTFLRVVIFRPIFLLQPDAFMALYTFYLCGFPTPMDNPSNVSPEGSVQYSSIIIYEFQGIIPVDSRADIIVAFDKLEYGTKVGINQIFNVNGFYLSLIMSLDAEHSEDDEYNNSKLDLLDPIDCSWELFTASTRDPALSPLSKPLTRGHLQVSKVLMKCSYQDILMLQELYSQAIKNLSKIPRFTRDTSYRSDLPTAPSSMSIEFVIESLRLLLIDDASAVYIPIFDIFVKKIVGKYSTDVGNVEKATSQSSLISSSSLSLPPSMSDVYQKPQGSIITCSTEILINYMNMKNSMWEPMLEPFKFQIFFMKSGEEAGRASAVNSNTRFKLRGTSRMDINVTKNFLNYYSQITTILTSSPPVSRFTRARKEPYRIVNESGCELRIWKSTSSPMSEVSVLKLENSKSLPLSFENWRDTRKGLHSELHSIGLHFLKQDKVPSSEESFLLWESSKVIPVYKEGIQYLYHHPKLADELNIYGPGNPSLTTGTRHPSHGYVVQVTLEKDNQKEIRILSPIVLENVADIEIEIGTYFKDSWLSWKIPRKSRIGLPPLLAYWNIWRIRPSETSSNFLFGSTYQWSKESFGWKDFMSHPLQELEFSCEPLSSSSGHLPPSTFYCHIFGRSQVPNSFNQEFPCLMLRVLPPFRLTNLLPFKVYYKVLDKDTKRSVQGALAPYCAEQLQSVADDLDPRCVVDLWNFPSQHLLGLAIHVVHVDVDCTEYLLYKSKEVSVIHTGEAAHIRKTSSFQQQDSSSFFFPSTTLSDIGDMFLECVNEESGEPLSLSLSYEFLDWKERSHTHASQYSSVDGFWSKSITLFAPYIICNQSDLPIKIRQHTFFVSSDGGGKLMKQRDSALFLAPERYVRDPTILDTSQDSELTVPSSTTIVRMSSATNKQKVHASTFPRLFSYQSGLMLKNRASLCSFSQNRQALNTDWSKAVSLEAVGSIQEVILRSKSPEAKFSMLNLSMTVEPTFFLDSQGNMLLSSNHDCKIIKIRTKYCVLNLTNHPLFIRNAFIPPNSSDLATSPFIINAHSKLPFHLDYDLSIPKNSRKYPDLEKTDWYQAKECMRGHFVRVSVANGVTPSTASNSWSPPLDLTQVGHFYFQLYDRLAMKLTVILKDGLITAQIEPIGLLSISKLIFAGYVPNLPPGSSTFENTIRVGEAPFYYVNNTSFEISLYQKLTTECHRRVVDLKPRDALTPYYWDLPCLSSNGKPCKKVMLSIKQLGASKYHDLKGKGDVTLGELDITRVGICERPFKISLMGRVFHIIADVVVEDLCLLVIFRETAVEEKHMSAASLIGNTASVSKSSSPSLSSMEYLLLAIDVSIPQLGISFIQDSTATSAKILTPMKYEILYCFMSNIEVSVKRTNLYDTFGVIIGWLQCDNQTTADSIMLYPTLLTSPNSNFGDTNSANRADLSANGGEEIPFLKIGIIVKTAGREDTELADYNINAGRDDHTAGAQQSMSSISHTTCIPYAGLLIQEFTLELDEEYLYLLVDFFAATDQAPVRAVTDYSLHMDFNSHSELSDATYYGQQSKLFYFEVFQLHPIKVNLTFTRIEELGITESAQLGLRSRMGGPLGFLVDLLSISLSNIHDAPLKFNSLLLSHPILPLALLKNLVIDHLSQQGLSQLHRFIGSADFLGNPIGLFNSFADGVSDLFYEPYLGFVSDRPQDFGIGIAKGGVSLLKNTVFGVTDTLTKFMDSISKGISLTTFDKEFQRQRIINRRRNSPKHALSGVGLGAKTLLTSVASGITGIVERPIEAVREEGVSGLWKGFGRGVIGLVTKPVLGVVDATSQVTQGIRNTTTLSDATLLEKIRFPRTLYYDLVLRPYSAQEAFGQFCMLEANHGETAKSLLAKAINSPKSSAWLYSSLFYISHMPLSSSEWLLITSAGLVMISPLDFSTIYYVPFNCMAKISKGLDYLRLDISADQANTHNLERRLITTPETQQRDWIFNQIEFAKRVYKQLYRK